MPGESCRLTRRDEGLQCRVELPVQFRQLSALVRHASPKHARPL
jgi:hypothetical protein